ncbi:hypothetical protein Rhe02_33600 [Rhizocola hellebori]|uniref:Uncharacterized protein n=1 Tax=Rhizocola hellebori TaxID=1392758 RepID=A0A8J3VGW2_9ACTN|nr:hypothetical protein Rhe02_33600 [Rhizocola hellebori]
MATSSKRNGSIVTTSGPSNVAEPQEGSVHVVEAFSSSGMRFTVLDEGQVDAKDSRSPARVPAECAIMDRSDKLAAYILERIGSVSPAT